MSHYTTQIFLFKGIKFKGIKASGVETVGGYNVI